VGIPEGVGMGAVTIMGTASSHTCPKVPDALEDRRGGGYSKAPRTTTAIGTQTLTHKGARTITVGTRRRVYRRILDDPW
jgi:hypothetical protein